ncbi:MAG: hypothetical protein A4E20_10905 [Nitrospira sp. SG-bin2]|uniref:hypothetical protein n=1 Tax=Nitrospira cf. moscoviensis SBR1015 TaxID=96242 RepID=UPI000A0C4D83|nr:hypothetical protein [Nitrospira cf. moscoviensis SBR1015]OQW34521.1 MAG: hypothetical protein A4E20_10905 [Nitrospira sp. SG-bin2]
MTTLEFLAAILGGGLINQLFTMLVNRRKNKLDQLAMIEKISADLRKELFDKYEERGKQITLLRRAIIKLTNLVDELLPRIKGLTFHETQKLKDCTLDTRLAGLAAEL